MPCDRSPSLPASPPPRSRSRRAHRPRPQYPERPITVIVPWGAGGGTDATARILASLLESRLGVPVSVVNRTGGSGVVGHSAIATAAPDGYTLGIVTVEIGMMHWQGLTELTYEDYTPLALYNEDPAGLQVRADSEWTTAQAVLDAVKASPGEHKASGTGQGGIWHLALAGMLAEAGDRPERGAVGAEPGRGARPAGPGRRRRRHRDLLGAGGAGAARGRARRAASR